MRLPEQRLYDWLQRKIGHCAMLERVENRVRKDTPDLYLAARPGPDDSHRALLGWVELKVLQAWPKRASTPVKIPHWTTGQRYWALRHRLHGGTTWLLVQVERTLFMFDAAQAANKIDQWTRDEWEKHGEALDMRNVDAQRVLDALRDLMV